MSMEVLCYPRSSNSAQIQANVEAGRSHHFSEKLQDHLDDVEVFLCFFTC